MLGKKEFFLLGKLIIGQPIDLESVESYRPLKYKKGYVHGTLEAKPRLEHIA